MPAMVEPKYERKRELKEEEEQGSKKMRLEEDRTVLLNTGARMPLVQFGTYKLKGEESYKVATLPYHNTLHTAVYHNTR